MPKFTRKELEFVIEPQVRRHCGPIFFTRSLETAVGNITNNGSFGLVDTGSLKLLVTCLHVWRGFQKARDEDDELKMCLALDRANPVWFNPPSALGEDETLDIATFDMAPYLAGCSGLSFFPLHQSPAPLVEIGDTLVFVGFPGEGRIETDEAIGFKRQGYGVRVCSVDGLRFQADVPRSTTTSDEVGGISGCPILKPRRRNFAMDWLKWSQPEDTSLRASLLKEPYRQV
jgi:hypothetical protein